jgi:hypothetical protein
MADARYALRKLKTAIFLVLRCENRHDRKCNPPLDANSRSTIPEAEERKDISQFQEAFQCGK